MKFAFLVHPLTDDTRQLLELHRHGNLSQAWGSDLIGTMSKLGDAIRVTRSSRPPVVPQVSVIDEFDGLISATGASSHGRLYEIPMLAHEILEQPQQALNYMEQAVDEATQWGARIVGLGSMTGIVGSRGQHLEEYSRGAITTGNSLTVYAALKNLEAACEEAHVDLREEEVVVVGIPGSIASAVARSLASKCKSLVLVGRNRSRRSQRLSDELNAPFTTDLPAALAKSRIVVSATSSGSCIDQADIRSGGIVVDIGVPTDVIGASAEREDILVLSGGLTHLPSTMPLDSAYFFFQQGIIPSCLGETMVLALEEREESFSLGQDLCVERIETIGKIAEEHGYDFSNLHSFGRKLGQRELIRFMRNSKYSRRIVFSRNGSCHGEKDLSEMAERNGSAKDSPAIGCTMKSLAERGRESYSRYINPVMTEIGSDLVKTFVRGENCYLWDDKGTRYLDFVAGFGSLNVGHNHADVEIAITRTLQQKAPGFVQTSINPLTAALAERLVMLAPKSLEMVFFTNSGAESVEAALKIARIATDRTDFVYCDRSYHGKSLGALSVTGNRTYQKPFGPLVGGCHRIEFNDLDALRQSLASRNVAAFIAEPIQAEGGMLVPDNDYLAKAQAICREYGTLLICDEVQTGLGRTGEMFACGDVEVDIMTLAKSLSGGVVPIGAMMCRREIWDAAYGTADRFALHTSTFSGGSVACAAGLASLDIIQDEQLAENAKAMGERLHDGLQEISRRLDIVRDIRGRGLLVGIELNPLVDSVVSHWKGVDKAGLAMVMGGRLDELLRSIPSLYVMSSLLNHFHIYTQTARSNPLVLRVQPPLTVNEQQIDEFLQAFEIACEEISYSTTLADSLFSRAGVGNHSA